MVFYLAPGGFDILFLGDHGVINSLDPEKERQAKDKGCDIGKKFHQRAACIAFHRRFLWYGVGYPGPPERRYELMVKI